MACYRLSRSLDCKYCEACATATASATPRRRRPQTPKNAPSNPRPALPASFATSHFFTERLHKPPHALPHFPCSSAMATTCAFQGMQLSRNSGLQKSTGAWRGAAARRGVVVRAANQPPMRTFDAPASTSSAPAAQQASSSGGSAAAAAAAAGALTAPRACVRTRLAASCRRCLIQHEYHLH